MTDNIFDTGIFTISLDTELAWGAVDKPDSFKANIPYYRNTRDVIDKLLKLFEQYNISATWAIVGHLFLESCNHQNGVKHPEIPRSNYEWYTEDWFALDPVSDIEKDPLWYGKDIVEKIMNCPVEQEIGCHSFSHIIFGDSGAKRETIQAELKESKRIAGEYGVKLKSFVFPRNSEGYLDELKAAGFCDFRSLEQCWYARLPKALQKYGHILDQALGIAPPIANPTIRQGLVDVPGSMLYLSMDGFRKYISLTSRIRKAKKGIKKAVDEKKIFHLWFHPFNIATAPNELLEGLEIILKEVNKYRQYGDIEVKTMDEISDKTWKVLYYKF